MKSILIYCPQMASIGGMETHLIELALLLASKKWKIYFITTSNSLNDEARKKLKTEGVVFIEMPVPRRMASKLEKLYWLTSNVWRLKNHEWDIVYTNGQGCLARLFCWLVKKKTRMIHHHHTSADSLEQKDWARCYFKFLNRVHELIACSEETRQNLIKVCGGRSVTKLLYLIPKLENIEERRGEGDTLPVTRKLRFGYLGRLVSTKGINLICDLSEDPDLEEIEWHLYGEGPDYNPEFFNRYDNLYYHGRYEGIKECSAIHIYLDAIVLFSRHTEGMPLSLIEAMSSGLPWIATDRGGTRELAVSEYNYELLMPGFTYDEAKVAVQRMVKNLRKGLCDRDKQKSAFMNHYSRESVGSSWINYLEA